MKTSRGIVDLYYRRDRREDWTVTILVVALCLGFVLGLTVGALIVSRQDDNRYEIPTFPREEGRLHYEQT